jgi:hypothetical protein
MMAQRFDRSVRQAAQAHEVRRTIPSSRAELEGAIARATPAESREVVLLLERGNGLPDRWFVTDGAITVGPIDFTLLERGVRAGKIGDHCAVRNEAWRVWQALGEIVRAATRDPLADTLNTSSMPGLASRPSSRSPSLDEPATEPRAVARDTKAKRRGARPARGAAPAPRVEGRGRRNKPAEAEGALTALGRAAADRTSVEPILTAAVEATGADAGLLLMPGDGGYVVRAAFGAGKFDVLGARVPLLDAVTIAAAAGTTILAEPSPGPIGRVLSERIARAGSMGEGALMVPVLSPSERRGPRLLAVLELGRAKPFSLADLAALAAVVESAREHLEQASSASSQGSKR